ncbi:cytochrome P450 [Dictyobacter kobayashii]|uniref:Cytochrome P450 n=1 Tax=Dictyobacter kobayashii TaxID=2014872 RepID=A0A402AD44_9CHLR|nr:cytochrome P450 [Dictyobacter kobayashii]GCE17014.1 cytochrome P450 [Dictyobacter kobayashii]
MSIEIKEVPGTKNIPGITETPLVGSMFKHNNDRLNLYRHVAQDCGDIGLMHYGPFRFIQISSPDLVRSMLVEHAADFDKGDGMRKAFQPVIGNGLFISDGALHRQQRKLMAPSFQPRHIVSYADDMVRYSEQIQQGWRDGQVVDIGHEMTQLTMSIVGKVLFDAEVFTEADELGAAMSTVLSFVNYSLSHLFPIPMTWPVPRSNKARQALAVLDRRINQMIADRRANTGDANDFLSVLLRARENGSGMDDKQLRDESLTLFGAGHETTATALTWAWYLLAQHSEIFAKVQHEVDTVLQGRTPTYADLAQLPYTLQVFKEAMRLYPPAYAVSRVALKDCNLDGYPIKKQDIVIAAIFAMHRRPEYFPDPEVFNPERFTPENEKQLPRYAYLPFGAGPRICIGNHFALMEGHLILATLAQHVTFDLVSGQQVTPDPNKTITIRPHAPIKMVVKRRS